MATTAILRSQDCLRGRFGHEAFALMASSSVRSQRKPNPNPKSNPISIPNPNSHALQSRRRKRSPVAVQTNRNDRDRSRFGGRSMVKKNPSSNLVMGQVKILKRGERLSPEGNDSQVVAVSPKISKNVEGFDDLVLGSTDRLGPDPEMVQKEIRVSDLKDGIYAGSAFVASPPPSSLPVPGFLGKNGAATSDLRRLLRLDLE